MKKFITVLFAVALICPSVATAQTPDPTRQRTRQQSKYKQSPIYIYCKAWETSGKNNKINLGIDYGQATGTIENIVMRDEKGNPLPFNSIMDACNWFSENGWDLDKIYTRISDGDTSRENYIFKKEVTGFTQEQLDETYSIFKTKRDFK